MFKTTPDLSKSFHPMPKPLAKGKKQPKPIASGKKTEQWNDGRFKLKQIFRENGITTCEILLSKCFRSTQLGFAHIKRRRFLTDEEIVDPHFVVLACNSCHHVVDFEMEKDKSEKFLTDIVKGRGW